MAENKLRKNDQLIKKSVQMQLNCEPLSLFGLVATRRLYSAALICKKKKQTENADIYRYVHMGNKRNQNVWPTVSLDLMISLAD